MADSDIPDFGAIFTFGKSRFADNIPSHFFIRNDPIVEISCGEQHTAVVCTNGRLFVFGGNEWGQLGLGHRDHVNKPSCVKMLKPEKVNHIACGKVHTIISVVSGKVYACGYNKDGQLGIGDNEVLDYVTIPTMITEITEGVEQLSAGAEHSALLTSIGLVYVWGNNSQGQLGLPKSTATDIYPRPILLEMNITTKFLCCGYYHTGFIADKLLTCGNNESGQLGIDLEKRKTIWTPQETPIPKRPIFINFGYLYSVAVVEGGQVYVCGSNSDGQLGIGDIGVASEWTPVVSLEQYVITQVSCGNNHTMFVTDKGELFCCGDTRHGKLVVSDVSSSSISITVPQKITEPFGNCKIMKVECGGCHSMIMAAVKSQNEDLDDHIDEDKDNEGTDKLIADYTTNVGNNADINLVKDGVNAETQLSRDRAEIKLSSAVNDNNNNESSIISKMSAEESSLPEGEQEDKETNPFFNEDNETNQQEQETDQKQQETAEKEENSTNTIVNSSPLIEEVLILQTMIIKEISPDDQGTEAGISEEKPDDTQNDSADTPLADTEDQDKAQQTNGKNRVKSKLCVLL